MLNREDVERIVENVLGDLVVEVKHDTFDGPNYRTVQLKYKGRILSESSFSVIDSDEFEW